MTVMKRLAIGGAVTVVLVATFLLYARPDFVVQLANQVWACF
jgi:hypothetical protein